jgi:hypothetical protein
MHRLSLLLYMAVEVGRQTKGYKTIDISRNEIVQKNIRVHTFWPQKKWGNFGKLKVEPVEKKLRRYKSNCLRHVTRMNSSRMARTMLNGRRRLGRPSNVLSDSVETGLSRSNWWQMMVIFYHLRMRKLNKNAVYVFKHWYSLKKAKYNRRNI